MRSFLSLSLLPLLAAASPVLKSSDADLAPIYGPGGYDVQSGASSHKIIPDSYIVVFKDHVRGSGADAHHKWLKHVHDAAEAGRMDLKKRSQYPILDSIYNGVKHSFDVAGSLTGYAGHFGEDVLDQIRRHPDVEYVELDSEVHTMGDDAGLVEHNAPWGLARLSSRDGLSFGNFNRYLYANGTGEGVDVYVIDTGTNVDHVDFEGRASWGKTIPQGDADEDGNGHGTHCSGTVAGKKYGVAKKAHVKAVKVLRSNGSGTMSDVVKGVEYAAEAHVKQVELAKKGKRKGFKGSTANMSLGGGKSPTLDKAVNAAVTAGIHFAVAAGNDNADSCNYSPASAENAVTVGASTLVDERAYFSNFGKCNDIFAPGLNIKSTWIGSETAVNTISGTSMASPHIAGLLAYLLSLQPSKDSAYALADITPKELKANLLSIATRGALADVPSSTDNILAWNGGGAANYSDIIKHGGYKVKAAAEDISIEIELPTKGDVEEDLSKLKITLEKDAEVLEETLEELMNWGEF